ncbi:MAG: hypothetical protein H0Z38_02690 [Firmicutes bacterium]|nr:hypothetical protein [Bacillota bacterium]
MIVLLLGLPGPVFASGESSSSETIEKIEVNVVIVGNVHPILKQRVERAVRAVAEKALLGRSVQEVHRFLKEFIDSLSQVYVGTITGFELERLDLLPGRVSLVEARFRVSEKVVERVTTSWELSEKVPDWIVERITQGLEKSLRRMSRVWEGLPLEAYSWAGKAISQSAEEMLPVIAGFRLRLSPEVGPTTHLRVRVEPLEPRVYRIELESSSSTLPPVILRQLTQTLRREVNFLSGLPVDYVRHNQAELENYLRTQLNRTEALYKLRAVSSVHLDVGAVTKAQVAVESKNYKLLWEGRINFGVEADPTLRLELGRYLSPVTRLIVGAEIPVSTLSFLPAVGAGVEWLGGDFVFLYPLSTGKPKLRYEHQIDSITRLRLERDWSEDYFELAYGIKNTPYLTTEIVGNNSGIWFRLVGSL